MLREEGRLPTSTSSETRASRRATRASFGTERAGDVKSVLIVDDVALVRRIHAGNLGKLGYRTIDARDGAEALRLYGENHAGLQGILLDVMMPGMDGFQTAGGIRELEQKQALRRMPIIAVTSLTEKEMRWDDKLASFDGHVDKPTSMSTLASIFKSMSMTPDLRISENEATGAAHASLLDPHGVKRTRGANMPSSSESDADGNLDGSNEGSSEQNGRKGSNSDRDAEGQRSSGGSGNEEGQNAYVSPRSERRVRSPGPDNRSRRPANATMAGSGKNTSGGHASDEGSGDASRQGSADENGELKSTMDTKAETAPESNAKVKDLATGKVPSADNGDAEIKTATQTTRASAGKAVENEESPNAKAAEENTPIPCARCGSDRTRFCYYNNGLPTQPRYYCHSCQRYWTDGGILRNLPEGSGKRKDRAPLINTNLPQTSVPLAPETAPQKPTVPVTTMVSGEAKTNASTEMQRAVLMLMTQVAGFDVNHAAKHAGVVASRAGEQVAQAVLQNLGHTSEAIEMAISMAKITGWRIGLSVSAVATASVSQGLNPAEISNLISTQLPFLADTLVREISEQAKTMKLTRKSPSGGSDSGGSGGTGEENGGKSATSAKSASTTATATAIGTLPSTQEALMQRWMSDLRNFGFGASQGTGMPPANAPTEIPVARKPFESNVQATANLRTIEKSSSSAFEVPKSTSTGAFTVPMPVLRTANAPAPMNFPMNPTAWLAKMNQQASLRSQQNNSGTPPTQQHFVKTEVPRVDDKTRPERK